MVWLYEPTNTSLLDVQEADEKGIQIGLFAKWSATCFGHFAFHCLVGPTVGWAWFRVEWGCQFSGLPWWQRDYCILAVRSVSGILHHGLQMCISGIDISTKREHRELVLRIFASCCFRIFIADISRNSVVPMEFITANDDESVRVWRVSNHHGTVAVKMIWGTNLRWLCTLDVVIEGVTGLSPIHQTLLEQGPAFERGFAFRRLRLVWRATIDLTMGLKIMSSGWIPINEWNEGSKQ